MQPLYHESISDVPGIYQITCIPTGKIYVGSAKSLRKRYQSHFGSLQRNEHHNPKLQNAFRKYGFDAFVFVVLEYVLFPEMLITREQFWLDKLKPFGKRGFNILKNAGSSLGRVVPQSSREKSRATQLGRPSTRVGWKPTPEQIEKRRKAMIGYKPTEEAKRNMAKAAEGRVHSTESIEKRRMKLLGHAPNNAKEFIVTSPDGVKYLVYHLKNFSKQHGLSAGTLIQVARGNRKHHQGWKACYLNPNEDTSKKYSMSDEARAKMSVSSSTRVRTSEEYASRRKTLILTSPDGVEYVVDGIHAFCQQHGLDSSSIAKVARGRYAHHHGWLARFPDEEAS